MSSNEKVLFVSRAYPPITGGIENQNFGIAQGLKKLTPTTIVANKHGKKRLPFFLPYALIKGLFLVPKHDVILIGDGVLAPIARFWKSCYPSKKYLSIVHGLDITFSRQSSLLGLIYRHINIPALASLDRLIMVGQETITRAVQAGISRKKCIFIPNGISPETFLPLRYNREDLKQFLQSKEIPLKQNSIVLLTAGRLVKRKGVAWFIKNVLPSLPENVIYLIAGDGPHRGKIEKTIKNGNLSEKAYLLGYIEDEERILLMQTTDIFIQPNIPVENDMEGFGIVTIEAGICARPVVASRLEGLQDAVQNNQNGLLVKPEDPEEWEEVLIDLITNQEKRIEIGTNAQKFVKRTFYWDTISQHYLRAFEEVEKGD